MNLFEVCYYFANQKKWHPKFTLYSTNLFTISYSTQNIIELS